MRVLLTGGAGFIGATTAEALLEPGESKVRPERFFAVDTAGTGWLLEVLVTDGVDRFVLSSTVAACGELEHTPIHEDDPLAPTNAYGESKLLVERMLAWHHRNHGLRTGVLRLDHVPDADTLAPPRRRAGEVEVAQRTSDRLGRRPRRDDLDQIVADAWAESPPGTDAGAHEP